jgi:hypothetical protein
LPQAKRGKQAGNTEHMVEMTVREQDTIEPPEAGAAAQELTLRAFAAIDEDAVTSGLDQKARMVTLGGGNAGGCAKEGEREHQRKTFPSRSIIAPAQPR